MKALPKHPGSTSVGWALVQAARLHRARMDEKLERWGLFAGQEQVIQVLASAELITMAELAAIMRVRPSTASKTVARLVALDLVERQPEPADGRLVRVRLTDEGKRVSGAIERLWDEVESELLETFDAKERKRLRKSLRRLARNLALVTGANPEGLDDELDSGAGSSARISA
jgi:DNA-binding MarR family transcriptional regulator